MRQGVNAASRNTEFCKFPLTVLIHAFNLYTAVPRKVQNGLQIKTKLLSRYEAADFPEL